MELKSHVRAHAYLSFIATNRFALLSMEIPMKNIALVFLIVLCADFADATVTCRDICVLFEPGSTNCLRYEQVCSAPNPHKPTSPPIPETRFYCNAFYWTGDHWGIKTNGWSDWSMNQASQFALALCIASGEKTCRTHFCSDSSTLEEVFFFKWSTEVPPKNNAFEPELSTCKVANTCNKQFEICGHDGVCKAL